MEKLSFEHNFKNTLVKRAAALEENNDTESNEKAKLIRQKMISLEPKFTQIRRVVQGMDDNVIEIRTSRTGLTTYVLVKNSYLITNGKQDLSRLLVLCKPERLVVKPTHQLPADATELEIQICDHVLRRMENPDVVIYF